MKQQFYCLKYSIAILQGINRKMFHLNESNQRNSMKKSCKSVFSFSSQVIQYAAYIQRVH